MMLFKAVLFDFDGVLIDSMPAHIKAWQAVFSEYGVKISEDEIKLREGEKAGISGRLMARKYNLNLSEEQMKRLLERKRALYAENAPAGMISGAYELLRSLKEKGYKLGLVTGSVWRNLKLVLKPEEIALFDCIITSEEAVNSKPHPEPYLKASSGLKIAPKECLVIENAPLGIEAAKSAGMKVVAITSTLAREKLKSADWVVDSLSEIQKLS
jgi:beta-phosphoglucomutase